LEVQTSVLESRKAPVSKVEEARTQDYVLCESLGFHFTRRELGKQEKSSQFVQIKRQLVKVEP
jgi:hypothetical protein